MNQIIYDGNEQENSVSLGEYFHQLVGGKSKGIKCTNYTVWKLSGMTELIKLVCFSIRLTFLRIL